MAAVYDDQLRTLRETQARLRALIENEPECVKLLDRDGRLLEMNAAGLRMIEADAAAQVVGHCVYGLVAPEHSAAFRALTERVCAGEQGTLEFEIIGLKGTRRRLETHAVPFREETSGETRLLAITRDISERHRLQHALRAEERRFRNLTELSSDWYWEQDEKFRFTLITGGGRRWGRIGLPFAMHLGKARWDLPALNLSEEDWALHRAQLERHESFYDFEIQRQHPDGSVLWASISGEPVFDDAGKFIGYRGVGRDITDRRRAEQALRKSEALKGAILDASLDAIVSMDHEGRVVEFNCAAEACFGYRRQDAMGRTMAELIVPPELRERHTQGLRRYLATGESRILSTHLEMPAMRADGTRFDVELAIVRIPGSEPPMFTGTLRDITERKRAQQALRESEQRFQVFLDHLPATAWIRDRAFRYTYVNKRYAQTWGVEGETLLGCDAAELFPPEIAQRFRETDERVAREGAPLEYIDALPSGRWLKMKFPVPDGHSGIGVAGIALDITERSRLEAALRESEQRFRLFMQHTPAAAWIKDAKFRYSYVNPTYEAIYGRTAADVLGCDDFELHDADRAKVFREEDERIRASGEAEQKMHAVPYADGRPGHWLVVKFPLEDGVGGIGIDVTPRLEAEEKARRYAEEVRDLANRLVQAQEAERRRIAEGLHDLIGQNLTALGIDLQALKQRLQSGGDLISGPRIEAMAALVETTIDAIRDVMTDLHPPALEEFGLVPAVRWHAAQFAKRTAMKVVTRVQGKERRLAADTELALFRILQEALTNAAKHSGGTVVEVRIDYADAVSLTVADNGSGFPKREGARAARRGGFGVPTMRERAEAIGGRLRIEFPDQGTRLVVEVP